MERVLFHKNIHTVPTSQGHSIVFTSPDNVERTVLSDGCYEPATLDFISANLKPGGSFAGAGSAYGFHLLTAAQSVGSDGSVVGIEPQPESLYRTYQNICASGLRGRIRLVSSAIARDGSFIPLTVPGSENRGSSSITARQSTHTDDYVVHGSSLQTIFSSLDLTNPPDLFVLDVEGFEEAVFDTFTPAWLPSVVVFEVAPWFVERGLMSPTNLRQKVADLGYTLSDLFGNPLEDLTTAAENNAIAWLPDKGKPTWLPVK